MTPPEGAPDIPLEQITDCHIAAVRCERFMNVPAARGSVNEWYFLGAEEAGGDVHHISGLLGDTTQWNSDMRFTFQPDNEKNAMDAVREYLIVPQALMTEFAGELD